MKKTLKVLSFALILAALVIPVKSMAKTVTESQAISQTRSILYAVSTGSNKMGKKNYACFIKPSNQREQLEIGAACFYGDDAKALIKYIQNHNFYKNDKKTFQSHQKIAKKILKNWNKDKKGKKNTVKFASTYKKDIVKLINSKNGKKCQDAFTYDKIKNYFASAKKDGVTNISGKMMYSNFIHWGGRQAAQRIVKKSAKPYTAASLLEGAKPTKSGNEVGIYKSRNQFFYNQIVSFLK